MCKKKRSFEAPFVELMVTCGAHRCNTNHGCGITLTAMRFITYLTRVPKLFFRYSLKHFIYVVEREREREREREGKRAFLFCNRVLVV